jgi:6-O-methylguanine DNA methyltransferase, DNA binding domain
MKAKTHPGMKRTRVPWAAKLRPEMAHAVVIDPKGRGQLLLPTPSLVAAEISSIPPGKLMTFPELRSRLAKRFDADLACPLMTGILFNIIAGAAEEQLAAGETPLAPYWRVVLENGTLSPKTPAGPERHAEHLRDEGHQVQPLRAKWQVMDYRQSLVGLGL